MNLAIQAPTKVIHLKVEGMRNLFTSSEKCRENIWSENKTERIDFYQLACDNVSLETSTCKNNGFDTHNYLTGI